MWDFLFHQTPLLYLIQSIWRDEAFSLLIAQQSPLFFVPKLIFEPPFYYILLHGWISLFGTSEIAARCLSLVGFILANVVVIFWGEKIFKKHWLSWFLPLFFFFNPHLLYYAFEIRAYGWYMFFAVTSMFAYWEKRWVLYVISTVLGMYTHTYMVIVPAVQMLYHILVHRKTVFSVATLWKDSFIRSIFFVGIFSSPWLIKIITDLPKLQQSWYFPVDAQIIKSAIGNIFLGYEGTPADLWQFTFYISLLLLAIFVFALSDAKTRARNAFFFLMIFVPLGGILGISLIKPLFVNRYILPSTIAQIFLVVMAIELIKHTTLQKLAALSALLFVIGFNIWYPSKHAKKDIRSTVYEINGLTGANDVVLTDSPLIFFETLYYSTNPSRVFWYNPKGESFPWYIGDIAFSPSQIAYELPPYPTRAFLIHTQGTLFDVAYNTPMHPKQPSPPPNKP